MIQRYMKNNHSTQVPRHIIFFDTETTERVSPLNRDRCAEFFRLGYAIGGRYERGRLTRRWQLPFTNIATFWSKVFSEVSPRHTTWLVAHNLIFDLVETQLTELFRQGIVVEDRPRSIKRKEGNKRTSRIGSILAVVSDPPNIIGCRHVNTAGRLVCVDSFNYFQTSVAEMGRACGLEKLQRPHFYDGNSEWFEYCQRDVEIVERTMCKLFQWCKDHQCGVFKYTAAGLALSAYRHCRMKKVAIEIQTDHTGGESCFHVEKPVKILMHDNMDIKRFERKGYFGGRTECFRLGRIPGQVHHLDVSSLFPSVMKGNLYPCKVKRFDLERELLPLAPAIRFSQSLAEVLIDTDKPILPFRYGDQTLYPKGKFLTVLCGPELESAFEQGLVTSIGRWIEYDLDDIFSFFVDDLWKLRRHYQRSGNKLYDGFTKMLLNSLYGKFGQRSQEWVNVTDYEVAEPWTTEIVARKETNQRKIYRSFGYLTQMQVERGEKKSTFPAISAFVTSHARMRMNQLRAIAGHDNVYYQGVDCLIVNDDGRTALDSAGEIADGELGKLRLLRVADGCELNGCGDYSLADFVAKAGRKSNAVIHPDGSWSEVVFSRASSLFVAGSRNYIEKWNVTKRPKPGYSKGNVTSDGKILPLELEGSTGSTSVPAQAKFATP